MYWDLYYPQPSRGTAVADSVRPQKGEVISGFFSLNALKEDRREEQYDSIFKSEKASYLMLRKYFDEIEGKIEILQKESKIPTEDIINAQKGIAKVVINRNKENADAIMNSNEQLMETFEHLENKLKESNDFIIESQKNVIYDNLKDIMEKQQVLSDSIKDMEIRLSQESDYGTGHRGTTCT